MFCTGTHGTLVGRGTGPHIRRERGWGGAGVGQGDRLFSGAGRGSL